MERMRDPYLYPNTEVLKNKFGVMDNEKLNTIEKIMASSVLSKMDEVDWKKISPDKKAESLSEYLAKLWKVHIFLEGNTRTIVTFICQYTESKGFKLDTELFEKNSAYVRSALVAASAVFKDLGDKSKPQYLVKIVRDALIRGESGIIE